MTEPVYWGNLAKKTNATKTDNYTVLASDFGKTLVMNSTDNKTFALPSVNSANVGNWLTFANINTGRLTIDAADSDIIVDSAAGATIYSDDNSIATITLELVSETRWLITGAHGTWVTT